MHAPSLCCIATRVAGSTYLTYLLVFCRENDLILDREADYQQRMEKEQQYNDLVKSLKDRVGNLLQCSLCFDITRSSVICKTGTSNRFITS